MDHYVRYFDPPAEFGVDIFERGSKNRTWDTESGLVSGKLNS